MRRIDGRPRGPEARRLYWVWAAMIQRCHNPNNRGYQNYGAKGITVCERWRHSFDAFFEDMGMPPAGASIERVNNSMGYGKANCRWADRVTQNRNRTSWCLTVNIDGRDVGLRELWEQRAHPSVGYRNFRRRLRWRDWSLDDALTRPERGDRELQGYRSRAKVA